MVGALVAVVTAPRVIGGTACELEHDPTEIGAVRQRAIGRDLRTPGR